MASVVATIATTSDPNASLPAPQISTNMDDTKVTHLRIGSTFLIATWAICV